MSKLVVLITEHVEKGLTVAEAWEAAGAPSVTIVQSLGLHRLREQSKDVEISLFVSMTSLLRKMEKTNQTIFTVVDDDLVDALIDAACDALGAERLDEAGAGVAFVIDVERTIGMRPCRPKKGA